MEGSPPPVTVQLGPNHTLNKDDLARALFCSMAVYMPNEKAETFLGLRKREHPSVTFEKVHMSLDIPNRQKFLLAYTIPNPDGDFDLFIAFKGTESLQDIACNLQIDELIRYGGTVHKGFFERSDPVVGKDFSPLPLLPCSNERQPRIIFCGHSLGGAISHMVLLRLLLESDFLAIIHKSSNANPDSMMSIAFGAPHVCDEIVAQHINNNANLRWRFINFVNQSDPIPLLLHDLKCTVDAESEALAAKLVVADVTLKSLGGFLGQCLQGYIEGGIHGSATVVVRKVATKAMQVFTQKGADLGIKKVQSIGCSFPEKPSFHPIGQYIFIKRNSPHAEGNTWNTCTLMGGDPKINSTMDTVNLKDENLLFHTCEQYKSVLIATSLVDTPIRGARNPSTPVEAQDILVSTPDPQVTHAEWRHYPDKMQQYIFIKGKNLLFLCEAVKVHGETWTTSLQSDCELLIYYLRIEGEGAQPQERVETSANSSDETIMSMVTINTFFGKVIHTFPKNSIDYMSESGVSKMISAVIQTLIVKATPPMSIFPTTDVNLRLDSIMQCLPKYSEASGMDKVSAKLKDVVDCDYTDGQEISKRIKEMNDIVKEFSKFLRSPLLVQAVGQKDGMLSNLKKFFRVQVSRLIDRVSRNNNNEFVVTLVTFLGGLLTVSDRGPPVIDGYLDVLNLQIQEAIMWPERIISAELEHTEDVYEKELVRQVLLANEEFKDMIRTCDTDSLKSETFRDATPESKSQFLSRIKVAVDTISLFQTEVAGKRLLGIFGGENTGKSTFIKKIMEAYVPTERRLPETGFEMHTTIVRSYRLNEALWLVDFPGSNGVGPYADEWKQFTNLPSSAMLVLKFEMDINRDQVQLYKKLKEDLKTEVAVVFNQVDVYFTERNKPLLTAKKFEMRRASYAGSLGCSTDNVFFACIDPEFPEKLDELKLYGVLGIEELAAKFSLKKT